jgi:hypothetical protein
MVGGGGAVGCGAQLERARLASRMAAVRVVVMRLLRVARVEKMLLMITPQHL